MSLTLLPANTPRSFYRGSGRIHRFRGIAAPDDPYYPEDWVGSTTSRFGQAPAGLTVLPDGGLLADAIAARPQWWLGAAHVAAYGADPAILVKLLDAGQRLPLHVHPDRRFAGDHLSSPYGKSEAWVIVEARPDAVVHLGFARDVPAARLAGWVAEQRIDEMLAATNRVPVRAGDAVVCPAGLPHAIGEGVFLVEVQEPTDFSVLLEWAGFTDGPEAGHLGLGYELALSCVDRQAWAPDRLAGLGGTRPGGRTGVRRLFPDLADPFFAAERLRPDPVSELEPSFSVVVVTGGAGTLEAEHERPLPVRAGDTVLVPYGAGRGTLRGQVEAVRCKPGGSVHI
ncbi:class I mannose-6-phosphate isomerase [Phytohabitans suffuscus]|uniref:Mannose-6-phosphate isomerase n=1 Tax=Phytohabitans suffuscus TaxID=624315 RepID=A0A6F8YYV4_9ACTN|nr:class I mannose-6-phosphate isomerase [Phytohabitans suffuscus]BCB91021.1 mannose-6-phosphate isomerase [Phytohabitans suffuscus]